MVFDRQGDLLVADVSEAKTPTLFRIDHDTVETIVSIPNAIFLNGMVHLADDRYLIADFYKGAIWEVNFLL